MTLAEDFHRRCSEPSDINQHLPALANLVYEIGPGCAVVEFGVRTGNSTAAFLHALDETVGILHSFDIAPAGYAPACESEFCEWRFTQADTAALPSIPRCDIFFIDTLHTAAHIAAELRHADYCRAFVAIHDTTLFGDHGEIGQPGITDSIYQFLATHPEWRVHSHNPANNGLLILART